jgi:hypothetical protein
MPTLEIPSLTVLAKLFARVEADQPGLLPACRWLVLRPELGRMVLPGTEPSAADLTALLRLLQDEEPRLAALGERLASASEDFEQAYAELCLDRLLEHEDWHHPTQVLDPPRPAFDKLLAACRARLERSPEGADRNHAASVAVKLERAVRISESARRKREPMGRSRTGSAARR